MYKYYGTFIAKQGYPLNLPKGFEIMSYKEMTLFVYQGDKPPHQFLNNATNKEIVMLGAVADITRKSIAVTKYEGSTTILEKFNLEGILDPRIIIQGLIEKVVIK